MNSRCEKGNARPIPGPRDYLDLHRDANTAALCLLRRLGNHMTLMVCSYSRPPPGAKYWPRFGKCDLGKARRAAGRR